MPTHHLLSLLQCIPRSPDAIAPNALAQKVAERFEVEDYLPIHASAETARKRLQRDISKLVTLLGEELLQVDRSIKQRPLYSLNADLSIPGQDPDLAVIWQTLAELGSLATPPVVSREVTRRTRQAARLLTERQRHWRDKVRFRSRLWLPTVPAIPRELLQTVQQALFDDRQLSIHYRPRGLDQTKHYDYLHPLLLLIRDGIVYLVARHDEVVKQFALNRMVGASTLPDACTRQDFDPDSWMLAHAEPDTDVEPTQWVFRISPIVAAHLQEQPLSPQDHWTLQDEHGYQTLTSQIVYSERFIWWLLGMGANIEVIEPKAVRQDMRLRLQAALSPYDSDLVP